MASSLLPPPELVPLRPAAPVPFHALSGAVFQGGGRGEEAVRMSPAFSGTPPLPLPCRLGPSKPLAHPCTCSAMERELPEVKVLGLRALPLPWWGKGREEGRRARGPWVRRPLQQLSVLGFAYRRIRKCRASFSS